MVAEVDRVDRVPHLKGLSDAQILYSESTGRFVVTVAPQDKASFEKLFRSLPIGCMGVTTENPVIGIKGLEGSSVLEQGVNELKECWKGPFGGLI